MSYLLVVKVDTNDADYIEKTTVVDDDEIELIQKWIKATDNPPISYYKTSSGSTRYQHNWPYGECLRKDLGELSPKELYSGILTEDEIELLNEYCPYSEYGFHSIEDINLYELK